MKQFLNNIKPHKFFLCAAIALGIIYNLVTPPLQVPDEHDHFRRVYHIASGHFLPQKINNRLGGEMPVKFREYVLPFRHAATNLKYVIDKQTIFNSFKVPLNKNEKEFNDFPNTSYYNPVSYLPQAVATFVSKTLNMPPAALYYLGRIFIYLFWMACMYFLIKAIPVFKWLFTFLVLLPMNIYISNSFSADAMTNILSMAFIVLVLKYALEENKFTLKQFLSLLVIGSLLALSKVVYVGLILSFFIIPFSKFNSKKQYFVYSFFLFTACFLAAFLWSGIVVKFFTPYYEYDTTFRDTCCLSHCANYGEQKKYILSHGTYFFKVIFRSLFDHPYTYLTGYIGNFGSSDIPLPRWLSALSYLFILLVAFGEKNSIALTLKQKLILFCAAFLAFVLLLLSQHLTWDCVGEGIVDLVQGRYLIPLFPMVFLIFTNGSDKYRINFCLPLILMSILLHAYSAKIIYNRFFKESYISKIEFSCGAEEVNEGGLFKTSNPQINVDGVPSKNDSVSHSGRSSILLTEKTPYGFTYRFKNLQRGDLIEIGAWQKGTAAEFIIMGKGKFCGDFFLPQHSVAYTDKNGWNRMEYVYTIDQKCTAKDSVEASFFIWNPGKDKTYVDDLKFSVKKFGDNYLEPKTDFLH